MTVSKIPGAAACTGILTVAEPPPTLTVTGTLLAAAASQGTWKVICSTPPMLPTLEIGAATLLTVTVSEASVVAQGPKALELSTRP